VATAFRRKGNRVVARLDDLEREVVIALMAQTRDLLAAPELAPRAQEHGGDDFDELVASLGLDDAPVGTGSTGAPPPRVVAAPSDPALERLLPSANREDPEAAAEFRRLTEHGLRQRKSDNLSVAIDALSAPVKDRVELDRRQAAAFVVALVDVRLLLGDRLGLRTDEDAEALQGYLAQAALEDPRASMVAYYDFLTWLQESLTQALLR